MREKLTERMKNSGLIVSETFSHAGWGKNHRIKSVEVTYVDENQTVVYLGHDKGDFHMHSLDENRLDGLTDAFRDLPVGTELEVIANPKTNKVYITEIPAKNTKSLAQLAAEVRALL